MSRPYLYVITQYLYSLIAVLVLDLGLFQSAQSHHYYSNFASIEMFILIFAIIENCCNFNKLRCGPMFKRGWDVFYTTLVLI